MFSKDHFGEGSKLLFQQHRALLTGRWLTDMANTSAFVFYGMPDLNWAGFYLLEGETLFLGPFQGKPACTEIHISKGVCGAAARERKTLVVPDVHEFPGYIACDAASQSEIVIPLIRGGELVGVFDVDSPVKARFTDDDRNFLEKIAAQLLG